MVTTENILGPIGPVKGAGFKSFLVEIKCFCHGSCAQPNISGRLSETKGREDLQGISRRREKVVMLKVAVTASQPGPIRARILPEAAHLP